MAPITPELFGYLGNSQVTVTMIVKLTNLAWIFLISPSETRVGLHAKGPILLLDFKKIETCRQMLVKFLSMKFH